MPRSVHSTVRQPAEKAGLYGPLYVTEHSVTQDFSFPVHFKVDNLKGLLFCQVVKSATEQRVVAWWKSQETFAKAWREEFEQLLGGPGTSCFEGFQVAYGARHERFGWLRPAGITAAVAALVALVSGLSTIQDWGYSLVARPDCTLWTDPVAVSKPVAADESFGIQIQVKNRHLRASGLATIEPMIAGDGLKCTDDMNSYPVRVGPGKAEVQDFRFVATRGGNQEIRFEGKQQGGRFYPVRNIPVLKVVVDVWDPIDQAPRVSLVKASDRSASVSVDVHNAKPTLYGTAFEATLTNPAGIDIRPDKRIIREASSLKNIDFAQLRWHIPPSPVGLTVQRLRLVLQESGSTKRSMNEWNDVLKRLTVRADEPDEPGESNVSVPIR